MTAYLKPGDRIMLAAPEVDGLNPVHGHQTYWRLAYEPLGVTVVHVAVNADLTHPVVIAVIRDDGSQT